MSKIVIVDDSDAAIVYQGNWTTASSVGSVVTTSTNEYNSTVHGSRTLGDKLTFAFDGISLAVWGTLDRLAVLGSPRAEFTIDGLPVEAFNHTGLIIPELPGNAMSHMLLYQSPILAKGPHTISIAIPATGQAPFYFDFFTVDVGSDMAIGNIIVDDSDSSIMYNGDWYSSGAQYEYMHTTHGMPSMGSGDATFSFFAESVVVYGTTGQMGFLPISFTLDGSQRNSTVTSQGSTIGAHTILFQADGLSETQEHTLVISALPSTNAWYLDYIVYKTNNATTSLSIRQQPPARPSKIGAIAGGVVGGVVLIACIVFGVFFFIRRRRRQEAASKSTDAIPLARMRSTRSASGSVDGARPYSVRAPSGILRSGVSFASVVERERQRVRISETGSVARASVGVTSPSILSGQDTSQTGSQATPTPPRESAPNVQYGGGFQSSGGGTEAPMAPPPLIRR